MSVDTSQSSSSHVVSPASYELLVQRLEDVYEQNKKIQRRLTLMVVSSYIKIALVLVPLILGVIYLPPLIRKSMNEYAALLSADPSSLQPFLDMIMESLSTSSQPSISPPSHSPVNAQ